MYTEVPDILNKTCKLLKGRLLLFLFSSDKLNMNLNEEAVMLNVLARCEPLNTSLIFRS